MQNLLSIITTFLLPLAGASAAAPAADTPLRHRGHDYKPRPRADCRNFLRAPFLQPQRDWERIDIHVPKAAGKGPLPCVVLLYGGGYGDKVLPFAQAEPLLARGFVLAVPDYALGTGNPVPLCAWDAGNAIRFLRANAGTYDIDPKRIGVLGWSAGGWIAQDLCYSDSSRLVESRAKRGGSKGLIPAIEPHPLYAEQSVRVEAVVSDWAPAS